MVQAQASIDLNAELERIQQESVIQSLQTYLELNKPYSIRVTTAQQICNMNDHKDVALVFDMRSESCFNESSLAKSINFSIEKF